MGLRRLATTIKPPRASGCRRFGQPTFVGTPGNGRDAPRADLPWAHRQAAAQLYAESAMRRGWIEPARVGSKPTSTPTTKSVSEAYWTPEQSFQRDGTVTRLRTTPASAALRARTRLRVNPRCALRHLQRRRRSRSRACGKHPLRCCQSANAKCFRDIISD